MLSGSRG